MKAILKRVGVLAILAGVLAFAQTKNDMPDAKEWKIEIIPQSGNTADFDLMVTAKNDGKEVDIDYDLGKDAVPQGPVYINVKDKDNLVKVVVERTDQVDAEAEIVITEMNAETGKKIRKKEFTMPAFEKDYVIIWNN